MRHKFSAKSDSLFGYGHLYFANGLALGIWGTEMHSRNRGEVPESRSRFLRRSRRAICGWSNPFHVTHGVAWTTRIGTRRAILFGGLLVAGTLVIPARVSSIPLLALSIFFLGAANSVMDVSMNAHAALIERDWESEIMSTFHSLCSFGALAGAALSGMLFARGYDPKIVMIMATRRFIGVIVFAVYPVIADLRPGILLSRNR